MWDRLYDSCRGAHVIHATQPIYFPEFLFSVRTRLGHGAPSTRNPTNTVCAKMPTVPRGMGQRTSQRDKPIQQLLILIGLFERGTNAGFLSGAISPRVETQPRNRVRKNPICDNSFASVPSLFPAQHNSATTGEALPLRFARMHSRGIDHGHSWIVHYYLLVVLMIPRRSINRDIFMKY